MKYKSVALLPCFVFLATFSLLNFIYSTNSIPHENFSIFAAIIALIVSIFTFQKNESFNERIEIFIKGSGQPIIIHLCYIFFLTTIFTTILENTGCTASTANLFLYIMPTSFIVPCIFIGASLFSCAVGTSIGTIAMFIPIAMNIAIKTNFQLPLLVASIVCGSIFGENLFTLCTIMPSKKNYLIRNIKNIIFNVKIILPAFICSVLLLTYQNKLIADGINNSYISEIDLFDGLKRLPYILTFYLALTGLDFIIIMVLGIMLTLSIGLGLGNISILTAINITFDGFYNSKNMVNVFILILLLSGLSNIVTHNGSIKYLIGKLKDLNSHKHYNPFIVFCLIALINIAIAIITAGQTTKKICQINDIAPEETINFPDIQPCVLQGMLPYIPQLLLASSMTHVPVLSLIPYLYYQMFLALFLLLTILWKTKNSRQNQIL